VWDNRNEAGRCANTERPLTHLVDLSDRQDEMKTIRVSDQDRFWAKVAPPDENGCMLWLACTSAGYGRVWFAGAQRNAHRVSLTLAEGEPPIPSMEAAHSCRNRHCVAPAHLRWATHVENEGDKVTDGTVVRGHRISHAKLTVDDVLAVRRDHAAGTSTSALARRHGVTKRAIRFIVYRQTWAWLAEDAS
jgi:hypothetical protein